MPGVPVAKVLRCRHEQGRRAERTRSPEFDVAPSNGDADQQRSDAQRFTRWYAPRNDDGRWHAIQINTPNDVVDGPGLIAAQPTPRPHAITSAVPSSDAPPNSRHSTATATDSPSHCCLDASPSPPASLLFARQPNGRLPNAAANATVASQNPFAQIDRAVVRNHSANHVHHH